MVGGRASRGRERGPAKRGEPWKRAGALLSPEGSAHTQYGNLRALVRRVGHRAGVPGLRPHLLRHAFATRMVDDGAPLPTVQRWLGQADMKTTVRYLSASPKSMQAYVRAPAPPDTDAGNPDGGTFSEFGPDAGTPDAGPPPVVPNPYPHPSHVVISE